jgi:hypothetical protein
MIQNTYDENILDKFSNYSELWNENIDECLDLMRIGGNNNTFKLGNVLYFYNFTIEEFCEHIPGKSKFIIISKEELAKRINIHLRKDKLKKIISIRQSMDSPSTIQK